MLHTFSDGCTYECIRVLPCPHDSPEAAYVEFEELYLQAKKSGAPFKFAGCEYYSNDFEEEGTFYPPQLITVDEWFAQAGVVAAREVQQPLDDTGLRARIAELEPYEAAVATLATDSGDGALLTDVQRDRGALTRRLRAATAAKLAAQAD